MAITVEITSGPEDEPILLSEAKRWLRLPSEASDEDADIALLIQAAREVLEARLARCFVVQTVRETRTVPDDGVMRLYRAPLREVLSVEVDGEELSEGSYLLLPNRIRLSSPTAGLAVITYKCGMADDPEDLPATVKLLVRALVEYAYDNRLDPSEIPPYILSMANAISWGGECPSP